MKTHSEHFHIFQELFGEINNEFVISIKIIYTNNGHKYSSS